MGPDRNIPTLDGWRAIAISLVLFGHGYPSLQRAFGLPDFFELNVPLGAFGVEIFFALSGYLITTKLLQEEQRDGAANIRQFYIRRFFRILPAALLLVLAVCLLSFAGVLPPVSFGRIASTALFFANYSDAQFSYYLDHFWSLAVEEHFYLIWPTVFAVCAKKNRLKVAIISALLIVLWQTISWKFQITTSHPLKYLHRTDIAADSIMWGVALAIAASQPALERWLRHAARPPVWLALAGLSVFGAFYPFSDWKSHAVMMTIERITVPLAIYGTVIGYRGIVGQLLDSPPLRWIGRISYSLYLWQQLFLVMWDQYLASGAFVWLQTFPMNFVAAFACAVASYKFVETPLIELGRRLSRTKMQSSYANVASTSPSPSSSIRT